MGSTDRISIVKQAAEELMRLYFCDVNMDGVSQSLAFEASWFGEKTAEAAANRTGISESFAGMAEDKIPCDILGEEYDIKEVGADTFVCMAMLHIANGGDTALLRRVTVVFEWNGGKPLAAHIHVSAPSDDENEEAVRLAKQSLEHTQERLHELQRDITRRERQLEVAMASIPGGLKSSFDDGAFTYEYISPEAAAIFGYTPGELLQLTQGSALNAIYEEDRARVSIEYDRAMKLGDAYSVRYRVRCKDGSLKWINDNGKRATRDNGQRVLNSLYLDVSHEQRSNEELFEQQRLLQSIYDTVPCGILRFTREKTEDGMKYKLISLNKEAWQLLGYNDMETCVAQWKDGLSATIVEEDRHIMINSNIVLRKEGDRIDLTYRVKTLSGEIRWINGTNVLAGSKDGVDVIQRMMTDITERRYFQERLEAEREMYRIAMESSRAIMFEYIVATDHFTSYKPSSSGESGGVIRTEIPDFRKVIKSGELVYSEDLNETLNSLSDTYKTAFEIRIKLVGSDAYEWYRVTERFVTNATVGDRIVGTLQNIQHEKEELTVNIEQLHMHKSAIQGISNTYISIYYADLVNDWYYAIRTPESKKAYVQRMGSHSASMAHYCESYVHPEDTEKFMQVSDPAYLCEQLKDVGQRLDLEYRHIIPETGESVWLLVEFLLISKENGKPKNMITTFRNINETRRQDIERRAREDAARRALEDAYKSAQKANSAKSDFLSKMSHDMRTPMNAIMGMTVIAKKHGDDPARVKDCLDKIELSGKHLLELINEVLDMSKIESGSVTLNEAAFDITAVVEEAAEMVRGDVNRRSQTLNIAEQITHKNVVGDATRIQQVLINLLSNAVKYTGEGGHIDLEVNERVSGAVSRYTFVVRDDGIGMSEEFRQKLFTPFERAVDSRVSKIEGTGLGLAITQNLVQLMGGSISVESEVDKGSCFTVEIDLKTTEDAVPAEEDDNTLITFENGGRILLAEDNDLNREICCDLLEMTGLEIEEAENGRQAAEMFERSAPGYYDVILMDIQMPIMDGYAATGVIRAMSHPDAKTIPIIALTANAFAEDVAKAYAAGMNEHLAKPLQMKALLKALKKWTTKS